MLNVKAQISNQIQSSNNKTTCLDYFFDIKSFDIYLTFGFLL